MEKPCLPVHVHIRRASLSSLLRSMLLVLLSMTGGARSQSATVDATSTTNNSALLRELAAVGVNPHPTLLRCYECRETYRNNYDPRTSPCRNNVTLVSVRLCGPQHKYCKVERLDLAGWSTASLERGCTDECLYGCRFNGYGVTYRRCTSCCNTDRCNLDNMAPPRVAPSSTRTFVVGAATAVLLVLSQLF